MRSDLLKHSNNILANSSSYSIIFNVQNLISAFIILFFNFTARQQQKSKVAISVQHIWTDYCFLDHVQFATRQFLPFTAHIFYNVNDRFILQVQSSTK